MGILLSLARMEAVKMCIRDSRQTLPGHVHAVAHLIPGIPEAVQSGQFYEIRITDADQIGRTVEDSFSKSSDAFCAIV